MDTEQIVEDINAFVEEQIADLPLAQAIEVVENAASELRQRLVALCEDEQR